MYNCITFWIDLNKTVNNSIYVLYTIGLKMTLWRRNMLSN